MSVELTQAEALEVLRAARSVFANAAKRPIETGAGHSCSPGST